MEIEDLIGACIAFVLGLGFIGLLAITLKLMWNLFILAWSAL